MVAQIDVESLKAKLASGSIKVLDIRHVEDYNACHIEPSQHVDNANLANFINSADKQQAYAVCCYHGISSQAAVTYLKESGFTDVASVSGGYAAYAQSLKN